MFFIFLLTQLLVFAVGAFQIDKLNSYGAKITRSKQKNEIVKKFFQKIDTVDFESSEIKSDPLALLQAAKATLKYIESNKDSRKDIIAPKEIETLVSSDCVKKTLKEIIKIIEQDAANGDSFRILDPDYLENNFKFIKWNADIKAAKKSNVYRPTKDQIRTTSYVIFCINGEYKKSDKFYCALYALNDDSISTRYTKQEILRGALERKKHKDKVDAIAWVTRSGLEKAQGMVIVRMPDKTYKILNVHKNNGYNYDKTVQDCRQQKRYWFFRELGDEGGAIKNLKNSILNRREVIFAGDIFNIGLGKIIALKYTNPVTKKSEMRLGVLADTGGAFVNNLYQLDIFAGVFSSQKKLSTYLKQAPELAEAYIVYKT